MSFNAMVFVGSLMNVFVLDRQVRVFFDKRRTPFPVFALSFLFYVVLINVGAWLAIPRSSMLIWFASRIVVGLNYEGSWKKRIIAALLFTPIGMALEMGILLMFGVYFDHFLARPLAHDFLTMTVTTLVYFMAALALQGFINLKKDVVSSPAVLAVVFALPLSSIALTFIFMVAADPSPLAAGFAGVILFGINILVFWLLDRLSAAGKARLEAALLAREKEYYAEQIRLMRESVERANSMRHDMKSHLAALKGIVDKNGGREATNYLNALLDGVAESAPISDTGNVAFDGIVNYKLKDAARESIKLETRLSVPASMNVRTPDLAAILGNLLDNALDAVSRVNDKRISLRAEHGKGAFFIKVENTFDGELVYEDDGEKPCPRRGNPTAATACATSAARWRSTTATWTSRAKATFFPLAFFCTRAKTGARA